MPSLCDRKFGQRVRICPCIEYPITARKKATVASTTAQSANDNQPPVTATARRLGVTSLATTTVKNTTTPLLRRVTTTPQPTKEKTVSDAPPKVKSIDLVLIGVIVAGSVSGFFFATVLISACVCTCRNRAKAEARSRRRAEAAASRQHRSRRSGRRRKKKKKKRSRRSRSHHSSDDSPGSPGRRRREDLHREASSISVHATVIQMADADDSGFAANPRAGPYNVNSELYGAETLTLTEMLESYNNFSY